MSELPEQTNTGKAPDCT